MIISFGKYRGDQEMAITLKRCTSDPKFVKPKSFLQKIFNYIFSCLFTRNYKSCTVIKCFLTLPT